MGYLGRSHGSRQALCQAGAENPCWLPRTDRCLASTVLLEAAGGLLKRGVSRIDEKPSVVTDSRHIAARQFVQRELG